MWDIKKERILKKMKFTTPIEMPRGTHYGSNYFIVYSHKIKRNVKLYSNLEYYNFLTLETDPNVEYFCEQPHEISVCIDNKLGKAIFDMFVEYRKPIVCSKREKGKDENTVICRFSRRRFPPFNRLSFWFLPVYSRMSANRFWQDSSSDSSSDYSYSSSDYEEEDV